MITPSFSLTATERVLPKFILDFTTAILNPIITVTRALNTATRVNSSGYVETVNADTARFDYDPVTLSCKGLLSEVTRINLMQYSEDFRDTTAAGSARPWSYGNATITADATTSPSNTTTADKLIEGAVNNYHYITQIVPISNATSYTISIYAKAAERNFINIQLGGGGFSNQGVAVNLTTGAKQEYNSPTSTSVTNAGNGWWRISITATSATTSGQVLIFPCSTLSTNPTYSGDGSSGIYIWGCQQEAGSYQTSYIPNLTSGTTTRNADVPNIANQGVVAQGAFVIEATLINGSTLLTSGSVTFSATASTIQKTAVAYDTNSVNKSIDSGSVTSAAGATAGTDITLGNGGVFKNLKFYLPKLINPELQSFSK